MSGAMALLAGPSLSAGYVAPRNESQLPHGFFKNMVKSHNSCSKMSEVTSDHLQCVFDGRLGWALTRHKAKAYAKAANKAMKSYLGTNCHWAAFLGNVGSESEGLNVWREYGVRCGPEPSPARPSSPGPPATRAVAFALGVAVSDVAALLRARPAPAHLQGELRVV